MGNADDDLVACLGKLYPGCQLDGEGKGVCPLPSCAGRKSSSGNSFHLADGEGFICNACRASGKTKAALAVASLGVVGRSATPEERRSAAQLLTSKGFPGKGYAGGGMTIDEAVEAGDFAAAVDVAEATAMRAAKRSREQAEAVAAMKLRKAVARERAVLLRKPEFALPPEWTPPQIAAGEHYMAVDDQIYLAEHFGVKFARVEPPERDAQGKGKMPAILRSADGTPKTRQDSDRYARASWYDEATGDADELRSRDAAGYKALIVCSPSQLLAWDFDIGYFAEHYWPKPGSRDLLEGWSRHRRAYAQAWQMAIVQSLARSANGWIARSGGGGFHIFHRMESPHEYRTCKITELLGIFEFPSRFVEVKAGNAVDADGKPTGKGAGNYVVAYAREGIRKHPQPPPSIAAKAFGFPKTSEVGDGDVDAAGEIKVSPFFKRKKQ